ncbi:glycosyl hydrolase family 28-related protein [Terrabacter terrigena]|uniref:Glycosyl hydrolase family 28-related protein n=1 Tax=Terrabacter terrigena TaxID=574718 RepID=A0ABW3MXR1_9MICO
MPIVASARYLFGCGVSDFAIAPPSKNGGFAVSAAGLTNGTLWSAAAGGTQHTDLQTTSGAATSTVGTDDNGSLVPFYGPPGVDGAWLDFGGSRSFVAASQAQDAHLASLLGDPTSQVATAVDARWARKDRQPVNVRDYGALGDGVADDTAALTAALTAGAGGIVELARGGTYRISGPLSIPSRTTLRGYGATLDASSMPVATALGQRIAVTSTGTIGADVAISTPVAQWSRVVSGIADTSALSPGDLILLRNDERPVPGMTRTDRDKGELAIIQSVDSATQVTLVAGATFAYGTTGLALQKLTPVEDVTIEGVRLKLGGVASGHNGIQIRYGRNTTVRDVTVLGAEDIAIGLNTVWAGKVRSCDVRDSTSSTTLGNTGYGVAIVEASKHCIVEDNHFYNCRHFVAGGGFWPPAYVDVKGNQGQRASDAAYDCHEPCFYWTFTKNTAVGVASGFIVRGQYVTVEENEVTDSTGRAYRAATFDGVTEQRGIRFINNKATSTVYGIEVDGQAAGAEPNCLKYDVEIRGNYLRSAGANPILLRHFEGAKVTGNDVMGSTSHALLILGLSGNQSKNLDASDNKVRDAALDSIKVQYVDDLSIDGGLLLNSGTRGIELLNCNRTRLSGVSIRVHPQDGVFISGGSVHAVSGMHITGGVGATYDCLRFSGTSQASVRGGYHAGPRYAVYATTSDKVVVTGVNAYDSVGSAGVKVNSDATTKLLADNLV